MSCSESIDRGTIFVSVWGYNKTMISFYVVTKRTPKSVWLRIVESEVVEADDTHELVVPKRDPVTGGYICPDHADPFRRALMNSSYGPSQRVRMSSHSRARPWNDVPVRQTRSVCREH